MLRASKRGSGPRETKGRIEEKVKQQEVGLYLILPETRLSCTESPVNSQGTGSSRPTLWLGQSSNDDSQEELWERPNWWIQGMAVTARLSAVLEGHHVHQPSCTSEEVRNKSSSRGAAIIWVAERKGKKMHRWNNPLKVKDLFAWNARNFSYSNWCISGARVISASKKPSWNIFLLSVHRNDLTVPAAAALPANLP